MKTNCSWIQTRFARAAKVTVAALTAASLLTAGEANAADKYWRTDGVTTGKWTDSTWGTSSGGPFNVGWTAGDNAIFNAASTILYVTATAIGNVTVNANTTVTPAGTLSTGGTVSTFTVADGVTLTWTNQTFPTTAGTGFIKTGNGTWDMTSEGGAYPGAFTLNAGTMIVSKKNSFGAGALTINGGTIQSSGSSVFAPASLAIGGDFTFSGTGNDTWAMATSLGGATRNITNSTTSGSRVLLGVISGGAGAGLNFWGGGGGTINIGNAGNTFTGPVTINGAEVQFQSDGTFGAVPGSPTAGAIVIDGGRLTSADTNGNAVTYTLNSNRGIQAGSTAGTSISVKSSSGFLAYNGIIADKPASTGILVKQGAGTLSLGGVSTYSGNTFINNGTVRLTSGDNRLPASTEVNLGQSASANLGVLDLNGRNQEIAGLNSVPGINASASLKNTVTNSAATATLTLSGNGNYAYGDGSTNNSGIITGAINLVKNGSGTQILGDINAYTGTTAVNAGTLALSGVGSIGGTPEITVASGATLDVSARTDGRLTLVSGQMLDGFGTVTGMVTAAGDSTLAPGSPATIGTLTVLGNATLNGTNMMKLSKTGATNDVFSVTGTLTYGGALTVTNVSGTLAAGDSFKLFNASAIAGLFNAINLPALDGSLFWDTSQLTNGILSVASPVAPVSYLAIDTFSLSDTNLVIGGTNQGAGTYYVLASTNLALPRGDWTAIATNVLSGSGNFMLTATNAVNPNAAQEFYILSTTNNY